MLDICKQLFHQWNDQEIKYCHWKSNEHLMEGLDGETDLDVFVAPLDKERAEAILIQCRYIKCLTQKGHRYPNVCEWIGFDTSTGRLVHVHLHYQIITGTSYCKEYVFPVDELIIESRELDKETNVYVTNPNLEIIILLCRIALKAKKKHGIHVGKGDRREIAYLKERMQNDGVHNLCVQLMGEDGDKFCSLIMEEELTCEEWYKVYHIASKWLKPYRKYSKLHVFFRHHYHQIRELFLFIANKKYNRCFINRKTFPNNHLSICLLGQDGSGKSTVTMELEKWLNWKIDAHRFYLGSGEHYKSMAKRLVSKASKSKKQDHHTEHPQYDKSSGSQGKKKKKNIKNFLAATLVSWNLLGIARRAYKEVRRANQYMKKGGIPLFDRFPQTQFEGIYDGPKIADYYRQNSLDFTIVKWMAQRECAIIKKIQDYQPRLVFKLMLSPEESIRRKPFENLEAVTRKHEITQQLQFPNSAVYIVDATQDYQQEMVFIKNKIWEALLQRQ